MAQIGDRGNHGGVGTTETCTKLYQRHFSSIDRTTWEADPNEAMLLQSSPDWRTFGYCCSGIFLQ